MNIFFLRLLPVWFCLAAVNTNAQSTARQNDASACQPPLSPLQRMSVVSTDISYATHAPPEYPQTFEVLGIGGKVVLLVYVGDCGEVLNVLMERSSRQRALDRSAVNAARGWHFNPGLTDDHRVSGVVRVPVEFHPDPMTRKYSPDNQPFPFASVDSALPAIHALPGAEQVNEGEGVTYYVSYAQDGPTIWEYFAAPNPWGPTVVRQRFLNWSTPNRPPSTAQIQISYRCEASTSACAELAAKVQNLVDHPVMPTSAMPLSPLVPQAPPSISGSVAPPSPPLEKH